MQARIDAALRRAVEAGEVPGVVAMAASEAGPLYEGAFGRRDVADGPAMTLDTVFRIASMTKAITSVAAMQLVEEGRLALDAPVPDIGEPALNAPQVLDGFDAAGKPMLRPAKRPITLKHLLTHTAGFTYDWSNPNTQRYVEATGMPAAVSRASSPRCASRSPSTPASAGNTASISTGSAAVEAVSRQEARRRAAANASSRRSACATPAFCRPRSSGRGRRAVHQKHARRQARRRSRCPSRSCRNSGPAAAGCSRPRAII